MRRLTEHQREIALHRIALAIGWDALQNYQRQNAMTTARVVLSELERGATINEKLPLEILLIEVTA